MNQIMETRRSIRRFADREIPRAVLEDALNAARIAPSGGNLQPLSYVVADSREKCDEIFPHTAWAAYVKPMGTPPEGKRPRAYVAVLANTTIRKQGFGFDAGAAVENMVLTAWEQGVGSCIIGAFERDAIREIFQVPEEFEIVCLVALGYPAHTCSYYEESETVRYSMDENENFQVPKRPLHEIVRYLDK